MGFFRAAFACAFWLLRSFQWAGRNCETRRPAYLYPASYGIRSTPLLLVYTALSLIFCARAFAVVHAPFQFYNVPNYYSGGWEQYRFPSADIAARAGFQESCCIYYGVIQLHQGWPYYDSLWDIYEQFISTGVIGKTGNAVRTWVSCDNKGYTYDIQDIPGGYCPDTPNTPNLLKQSIPSNLCERGQLSTPNPINMVFGNKYLIEDIKSSGAFPLRFTRTYNSIFTGDTAFKYSQPFGKNRRHAYERTQ